MHILFENYKSTSNPIILVYIIDLYSYSPNSTIKSNTML